MSPYDIDQASEAAQWELDHPGGVISAEEMAAMDRYAYEACREERCHATRTPAPYPDCAMLSVALRTQTRCPACAEEDDA